MHWEKGLPENNQLICPTSIYWVPTGHSTKAHGDEFRQGSDMRCPEAGEAGEPGGKLQCHFGTQPWTSD